jgi:hypothetical protein
MQGQGNETPNIFRRKTLLLSGAAPQNNAVPTAPSKTPTPIAAPLPLNASIQLSNVLVVNASHEMAKEITLQLTLKIPSCSIMYAPTIEVARWILSRRSIDLVVASPILPDGSVTRLRPILEEMESPPDLIVVGNLEVERVQFPGNSEYKIASLKRFNSADVAKPPAPQVTQTGLPIIHRQRERVLLQSTIKNLGADIRNDLNNPLQEIVAMVFVAKTGSQVSEGSNCALDAIERAALNMSKVVNALEDKIRGAIS